MTNEEYIKKLLQKNEELEKGIITVTEGLVFRQEKLDKYEQALKDLQLDLANLISTPFFNKNDIEDVIGKINEVLND